MKIQYVSIKPTKIADELSCPALVPELLASTGARYSRNNEGLYSILSKIDPDNQEKSIDAIFKFLDYGHASVSDMVPIALFIDDVSLFAAYFLWTLAPTAGGQECSTRYIKLDAGSVVDPDLLGIPDDLRLDYWKHVEKSFKYYELALEYWTSLGNLHPELTKIPSSLINSSSDKDKKQVARMMRNFAFDRARVYLPVSAMTGVMMIQSARAWANMSAHLQSHPLRELNLIGKEIEEKLKIGAPRLVKHCKATDSLKAYYDREKEIALRDFTIYQGTNLFCSEGIDICPEDLNFRANRYSPFAGYLSRLSVKFTWGDMSFGEIRDLNRHRTGTKYCPMIPVGFYGATDQLPTTGNTDLMLCNNIQHLSDDFGTIWNNVLFESSSKNEYIYFTNLGHQYYFEHTTTADKFLYEMELRTGVGAHYKYAEHCHKMLELWYQKYPQTKNLIFEGSAEPE